MTGRSAFLRTAAILAALVVAGLLVFLQLRSTGLDGVDGAAPTGRSTASASPSTSPSTTPSASPSRSPSARSDVGPIAVADLPSQARATITRIQRGGPFPYSRDGLVFENREGLLPSQPRGYYHEYTVATPGEDDRGARRLVQGSDGTLYWSPDHYRTFRVVQGVPA